MSMIYNNAASFSSFPSEMLQAMIITLPKPGKTTPPQNFRPISKPQRKNIHQSISIPPSWYTTLFNSQWPEFKGRQVSDATRRLISVIHHAESTGMPSQLLSLDEEKAFDRIHWTYLQQVLHKFGFWGKILNAMLALYTAPTAKVLSSDMLYNLSTLATAPDKAAHFQLIFNLLMEPLATHIRSNPLISKRSMKQCHSY